MKLRILDLGLCAYSKAHEEQFKVLKAVQEGEEDTLILVEHPKVITMGRNAQESNMLVSEEALRSQGYEIKYIERGGDATYHGPGQLVGYTLFNLKKHHGGSVRTFVEKLEESFIEYLKTQGLEGKRDACNAGVFIGNSKITAIGLAIKKGVAMHGFAFNVNTNLKDYGVITPCGLVDKGVTSLTVETGRPQDMTTVKKTLVANLAETMGYREVEWLELVVDADDGRLGFF